MVFYDNDWSEIARLKKCCPEVEEIDSDFINALEEATGIPTAKLLSRSDTTASVAQKMSWHLEDGTTRQEDEAHCLLGLFIVHIALLYGEGAQAFRRLQEKIMITSSDHTLFSWSFEPRFQSIFESDLGFFAKSVAQFRSSGSLRPQTPSIATVSHYSLANMGV